MSDRLDIIGLEETVVVPALLDAWARAGVPRTPQLGFGDAPIARRLRSTGETRLSDMDEQGIDAAVLSLPSPGVHQLPAVDAVAVARDANDELAAIVAVRPDRYDALAVLPTADPVAAAAELERAVDGLGLSGAMLYGRTGDVHADSRVFDDLYATAARLGAPLHFHPQVPPRAVIDAYCSDLDAQAVIGPGMSVPIGFGLATAGIGWYYDAGVEFLRMIFSGTFDRFPDLQVIAGHSGEVVLFYADHTGSLAAISGLQRTLLDYFRHNFWITGSGTVSPRFQRWTAELVGTGRMLYSTDYPYTFDNYPGGYSLLNTSNGVARTHLESAPFSYEEKIAIGSGNWRLLKDRRTRT